MKAIVIKIHGQIKKSNPIMLIQTIWGGRMYSYFTDTR
jgi:hypothetical protein